MLIKDLKHGELVDSIYLVKDIAKNISSKGLNYLSVTLQDKSGTIECKKWTVEANDLVIATPGSPVRILGTADLRNDKMQIIISSIYAVSEESVNFEDLLLESPIPLKKLLEGFEKYKESIQNQDCKRILDNVFGKYYKKFIEYPAAVRNHHEFYHGLLYHSVSMCMVADFLAKHYSGIDRDLLITGCLLHDVGKVKEFSGPIATKYTTVGNLMGHLAIGAEIVNEAQIELNITSEVPMLLKHMLLSHHGQREYGAAVLPLTKEAQLLSMIDDMDSKMIMIDKSLKLTSPGEFGEKIYGLDGRSFYKPKD